MAANRTRKEYINLVYKFIRGLINDERYERKKHWMKHAAEWISRAIMTLDLTNDVIKNVRQATALDGIGDKAAARLGKIMQKKQFSADPPHPGKFVSSASALLVAMYLIGKEMETSDMLDGSLILVSEDQLRQVASAICEEEFKEVSSESGGADSGFCPAWWRLTLLASRGYVKKRSRNKKTVYELLQDGAELAKELIERNGLKNHSVIDLLAGRPVAREQVRVRGELTGAARHHLYTNDDEQDGVLLYVDLQEGGGQRKGLSAICRRMEQIGVRYATRRLVTGDYSWVWNCGGQKVELPVLVERKRADDLAGSIMDGRYNRQKAKMVQWAQKYGNIIDVDAELTYLVEGDPKAYVVQCADGCGGVGKCGHPNVRQIELTLGELENSQDFKLIRTRDITSTVDFLVTMTRELEFRVKKGDFYPLLVNSEELENAADNNASRSTPTKNTTKKSRQKTQDPPRTKEDVRKPNTKRTRKKYIEVPEKMEVVSSTDEESSFSDLSLGNGFPAGPPGHRKRTTERAFSLEEDVSYMGNGISPAKRRRWQSAPTTPKTTTTTFPTNTPSSDVKVIDHDMDDVKKETKPVPNPYLDTYPSSSSYQNHSATQYSGFKNEVESESDEDSVGLPVFDLSNVRKKEEAPKTGGGDDIPAELKWSQELKKIRGIRDFDLGITVSLLEHHHGNVEHVISALFDADDP